MLLIKNMKNLKYIILFALILACESSSDSIGSFSGNGVQSSTSGEGSSNTGIGGSMARFTIVGDYLYTVDSYNLKSFDISDKLNPEFREEVNLGWGVETIFPYDNNLFIGTQSGMHIYSLEKREKPSWISTYEHITSCDPVVVQGDYAYFTLRGGAECQNFNNQLDIIDISELEQPSLFKTYPMINPHGLGIDDNCLFITEGEYGLKMYDITNIDDIILKKHFKDISSIDVIPFMDVLMVIGSDGFHQYNYDCELGEIEYISTIPIKNL